MIGVRMSGQTSQPSWRTEVLLAGSMRGASSVLISNGHLNVVVDTGLPHEESLLVGALERQGLKPSDIQIVVNTHFHVDHVLNNRLFTKSLIYAPQESYDWAKRLYTDLRVEGDWEKRVLRYYPEVVDDEKALSYMSALRRFALRWWDEQRLGSRPRFAPHLKRARATNHRRRRPAEPAARRSSSHHDPRQQGIVSARP